MAQPNTDSQTAVIPEPNAGNAVDITGTVRVDDPQAVGEAVLALHALGFPGASPSALQIAFDLFARLYGGRLPGFHPCDTLYHDIQHSLDITLTTARLLRGYHKVHGHLSEDRFVLGVITALFHDAGYVRRLDDTRHENGAEHTGTHVSRGARFMAEHLPPLGLDDIARRAGRIVHLTGYEIAPEQVQPADPSDRPIGDIVATADLITQMADRCYLEKCRDRLYPELALAARADQSMPFSLPLYPSPEELLRNTPGFYRVNVRKRLEQHLNKAFRYAAAYFGGPNHYIAAIENNIRYLERLIEQNTLDRLRRRPPANYGLTVFPYERLKDQDQKIDVEEK